MALVLMIANDIWSEWGIEKPRLNEKAIDDRTLMIEAETRKVAIEEES